MINREEEQKAVESIAKRAEDEIEGLAVSLASAVVEEAKKSIRSEVIANIRETERLKVEKEYRNFLNGIRIDSFEKYLASKGKDVWYFATVRDALIAYQTFIRGVHKIALENLPEDEEEERIREFIEGGEKDETSENKE